METLAVGRVQYENGRGFAAGVCDFVGGIVEKVVMSRQDWRWRNVCERATFDVVLDDAYCAFGNVARENFLDDWMMDCFALRARNDVRG